MTSLDGGPTVVAAGAPPSLGSWERGQPVLLLGSIVVGLALGAVAPGMAATMAAVVPAAVFVLLLLVMLGVEPGDVAVVVRQRRFLAAAVLLNFVLNPALAWLLGAVLLGDQPELRIGLVLFLVTPCIGWYLAFTDLAGGDTAAGVGLLGLNLVLQLALLPLYLLALVGPVSGHAVPGLLRSVVLFLVLPALMATGLRRWVPRTAGLTRAAWPKPMALAVVIVAMFASQAAVIVANPGVVARIVAPLGLFFLVASTAARAVGARLNLPPAQTTLLVFTATSRNSEASLAIAATAFASPLVGLVVVLGPVIELPVLIVLVRVLRRGAPELDPATVGHET